MDRLERKMCGVKPGVTVAGVSVQYLLNPELRQVVNELAIRYQRVPVEPGLDKQTGAIIPDQPGCIVDVDKSIAAILAAPANSQISLGIVRVNSTHSAGELAKAVKPLTYFKTGFSGSQARLNNISIACSALNNSWVWGGDTFSFNEIVGPRTAERGYLPAPVILQGTTDLDFGGGVCQVSSTLFNAVSAAGFRIIERHSHTKPVHYVAEDRDAAVNYGYQDFQFTNTGKSVIIIKAGVTGGRVWVRIVGEGAKG